jgi:hypothetical protein
VEQVLAELQTLAVVAERKPTMEILVLAVAAL